MVMDQRRAMCLRRRDTRTSAFSAARAYRLVPAFLRTLAARKSTLSVAAIQASIKSPDRADDDGARAENLQAMLSLLDKVQTYGAHKDVCLFPVVPLPGDAIPALLQAARRYACTLVYGTLGQSPVAQPQVGLSQNVRNVRLMTTISPNGEVRIDHATCDEASALVLRTRNGLYRAVACAADAWYPGDAGITTAIHSPDGRPIVATRSRGEQVIAAVLHVTDSPNGQPAF